jgi:hypothetical protein
LHFQAAYDLTKSCSCQDKDRAHQK